VSAPRRKESPGTRSERPPPAGARSRFRDRVVELRRVPASELEPHPKNWRRHPERQRAALRAMLREVGFADALIARQDQSGKLVLIDGHLRKSLGPRSTVPVLVVDLDEEEADKLLAALAGEAYRRITPS